MAEASMDDILSGKDPEPVPEPAQAEPVIPAVEPEIDRVKSGKKAWQDREQEAQGRVRDPATGQFAPKPEEPVVEPQKAPEIAPAPPVPPKQEFTEKEKAFLKAAHEERAKRQELERQIAELKKAPIVPAETKTFWDDPEAALANQKAELKATEDRLRQEANTQRLNVSEFMARKAHPDFDEKVDTFAELLKETPGLHEKWLAASDPAEFAYAAAKAHLEFKEAGSIEGLRAKIEKETRIKIEAELKAKAEALTAERAALPPSLSDARSKGANRTVWSGPPSMESILKP